MQYLAQYNSSDILDFQLFRYIQIPLVQPHFELHNDEDVGDITRFTLKSIKFSQKRLRWE